MLCTDAVILCGGKGTRLRDVVADRPKPLAEIGGRPFVEYVIDQLGRCGVTRLVISAGYMAEVVEKYFSAPRPGCDVTVVTEKEPLGTGGAVRFAFDHINTDRAWVLNGDSYCGIDLHSMCRIAGAEAVMAASRIENAAEYGSITVDQFGWVTRFAEKTGIPGPGIVNAGIYLFNREHIERYLPAPGTAGSLERDVLPRISKLAAYVTDAPLIDIGTQERFSRAQDIIAKGLLK